MKDKNTSSGATIYVQFKKTQHNIWKYARMLIY